VTRSRYALWFRWSVFVGILQDWLVAIPGVFVPNAVLALAAEPAAQPVWPAFGCSLLLLLSLFYVPGALDPFSHRATAVLTVVARFRRDLLPGDLARPGPGLVWLPGPDLHRCAGHPAVAHPA